MLNEAIATNAPLRCIKVDPLVRAGVVGLQTTERFRAISDVLSRPIGEFQANRFFTFLAMIDTRAISVLVRSSTGSLHDEAAYVRCMPLSELVVDPGKIGRLSHAATRMGIDLRACNYERQLGEYTTVAPTGKIAAVDLTYFSQLMTRKTEMSATKTSLFGVDTWGTTTAVVPILMEYGGTRALPPYALSFVSTAYWNVRVGYRAKLVPMAAGLSLPSPLTAHFYSQACQAVLSRPTNILFVVVDTEVHPTETVYLNIGKPGGADHGEGGIRRQPTSDPTVRGVVNGWLGAERAAGRAPGRQRDAYHCVALSGLPLQYFKSQEKP